MMTHDFGSGGCTAHRHVNPDGLLGGWVADTAYVDPTCYVHESAIVFDTAKVLGTSKVSPRSIVCDDNVVENSTTWVGSTNIWMLNNCSLYNCV